MFCTFVGVILRTPTSVKSNAMDLQLGDYEDLGVRVLDDGHVSKRCRYLNPNSTVTVNHLFSIFNDMGFETGTYIYPVVMTSGLPIPNSNV